MNKKEEKIKLQKMLKYLDTRILAIKAAGGYKYRSNFKLSDLEFEQFYTETIGKLQLMVVSLIIAEQMFSEAAPSIHPRVEEYTRRVREAVKDLGETDNKRAKRSLN